MYSSEIPTKPPGTQTHPLKLANPASGSIGRSSRLSLIVELSQLLLTALPCWLRWSVDCPCSVLLSSVICLLLFSSGLVRNLVRKPFVWVSRQNSQRVLWLALTPTPTETYATHHVTRMIRDLFAVDSYFLFFSHRLFNYVRYYQLFCCPVGSGCIIHQLHPCRRVRPPPMRVLDMTLNNVMVTFQWCRIFGESGAPIYCHCSQVHSGPEL